MFVVTNVSLWRQMMYSKEGWISLQARVISADELFRHLLLHYFLHHSYCKDGIRYYTQTIYTDLRVLKNNKTYWRVRKNSMLKKTCHIKNESVQGRAPLSACSVDLYPDSHLKCDCCHACLFFFFISPGAVCHCLHLMKHK